MHRAKENLPTIGTCRLSKQPAERKKESNQCAQGQWLFLYLIEDSPAKPCEEQRNADNDTDARFLHAGKNIGSLETVQNRYRRAEREWQQQASHCRVGMVEGKDTEKIIVVVEQIELDHTGQVRRQVAL